MKLCQGLVNLFAAGKSPLDRLLVPGIPSGFFEGRARKIHVSRFTVFLWANVNNLCVYSGFSLDLNALSAWATCLVEVSLIHGNKVGVPFLSEALWVETACISSCSVHLASTRVCSCDPTSESATALLLGSNTSEHGIQDAYDGDDGRSHC